MNKLAFLGALIGALVTLHSVAMAQFEPLRRNESWCLESREGGGRGGGGGSLLCRFETYGQCMASRTTQGDRCIQNPWVGARPYRRNY